MLGGQAFSVAQPNELQVVANGQPVAARPAARDGFQAFEPVPVPLKAGENVVELVSESGPTVLPNDNRELAIAVKDLSLTPPGAAPCSMQP